MNKAYTIAIGNFSIPMTKDQKKVMDTIIEMEGFIGVHPVSLRGTLLLFETENKAKIARNILRDMGVKTGHNICEVVYER